LVIKTGKKYVCIPCIFLVINVIREILYAYPVLAILGDLYNLYLVALPYMVSISPDTVRCP
jgi:hypothetical protein